MPHIAGQEGIIGCYGPISPTATGIELFMKAYLMQSPWIEESNLIPLPWRDVELPPRVKIGVMWWDGTVQPHPPVRRAMKEAVAALKWAGVLIVDWDPEGHDECWEITRRLYFEDGGQRVRDILDQGNEPAMPLTKWLLEDNNIQRCEVETVWDLKARRNAYRARYNDIWLSTGAEDGHIVDAILCPAGPGYALPHDQSKYWGYTSQWNMLEYPAAVFPVTCVDQALDLKDDTYTPVNDKDRFNYGLYPGPELYKDAPVCLQVVMRRYEDEKCVEVLKLVDEILRREASSKL